MRSILPSASPTFSREFGGIDKLLVSAADITAVFLATPEIETLGKHTFDQVHGTSWQLEELGTATRGTFVDMPQARPVALGADYIDIHDAGEPGTVPLWMQFNGDADDAAIGWNATVHTCVECLNGMLFVGSQYGLLTIDFVRDRVFRYRDGNGYSWAGDFKGNLAERNSGNGFAKNIPATAFIVDNDVNAVAVTVLPGAELDERRGLPYQTIAVATDGGVSIINPTGTKADVNKVVDWLTNWGEIHKVAFYRDGLVAAGGHGVAFGLWGLNEIPTDDTNGVDFKISNLAWSNVNLHRAGQQGSSILGLNTCVADDWLIVEELAGVNTVDKVKFINHGPTFGQSVVGEIAADYFTGGMVGDTSVCALVDTVAGTITGGERIANGTFPTDLSGWMLSSTATSSEPSWVAPGYMQFNSDGSGYSRADTSFTTVVGVVYIVAINIAADPSVLRISVGAVQGGSNLAEQLIDDAGMNYLAFTATSTTTWIRLQDGGSTPDQKVSKVSVMPAALDRSSKGNHAQVFGTLTKSPVADGAELVGFSGWDDANYVLWGHDLDPDGNIYLSGAFKGGATGSVRTVFEYNDPTGAAGFWLLINSNGNPSFRLDDGTNLITVTGDTNIRDSQWHRFVCIHDVAQNVATLHIDGQLIASESTAVLGSLANPDAALKLGAPADDTGKVALLSSDNLAVLRAGNQLVLDAQIETLEHIERKMFEPGGTASLGVTQSITCLDYSFTTGLAYIGTAGGGVVVLDIKTMQRVAIITSANSSLTNNTIKSVSANGRGVVIASAAEAIYMEPSYRIRETVACA